MKVLKNDSVKIMIAIMFVWCSVITGLFIHFLA